MLQYKRPPACVYSIRAGGLFYALTVQLQRKTRNNIFLLCRGAYGSPSLIQEMVEERQGFTFPPERQEILSFFRIFTLAWAAYFAAKAILYGWLGTHYPLPKAIALRSTLGTLSLAVMVLVSMQGRRIFFSVNVQDFSSLARPQTPEISGFLPRYQTLAPFCCTTDLHHPLLIVATDVPISVSEEKTMPPLP